MKSCKLCSRNYDDRVDFCFADGTVLELALAQRPQQSRLSEEHFPTMVPEDIGLPRAPMSRSSSPTLLPDMDFDEDDFETPEPAPLSANPEPTIIPEDDEFDEPMRPMRGPFGGSILPEETAPLPIPIIRGEDRLGVKPKSGDSRVRVGRSAPTPEPPPPVAPRASKPVYQAEAYQFDQVAGVFDEDPDPDERPTEIEGSNAYFAIEDEDDTSDHLAAEHMAAEHMASEFMASEFMASEFTASEQRDSERVPAAVPMERDLPFEPEPEFEARPSLRQAASAPALSSNPPDIRVTRPRQEDEPSRAPLIIAALLLLLVVITAGWWFTRDPVEPAVAELDPPVTAPITAPITAPPEQPVVAPEPPPEEPVVEAPPEEPVVEEPVVEAPAPEAATPVKPPPENTGTGSGSGGSQANQGAGSATNPTPPPKPTTGQLSISVTPSSAMILVDGKQVGAGRASVTLGMGRHEVTAQAEGYATSQKRVTLDGASASVTLNLEKLSSKGFVQLFGPPDAAVYIGERKVTTLPAMLELSEGSYTFRVVTPDGVSYTVDKTVLFKAPGQPVNISLMP